MKRYTIDWTGKEYLRRVLTAQKRAVNRIMSRCVIHAKQNHPWTNRTGILEGSIRITDYAYEDRHGVAGLWGSADTAYAIFLELGTSRMPAFPFLRPAADAVYPELVGELSRQMERSR